MVFNTFVGVLIEKFIEIKNEMSPYKDLSKEKKEWCQIKENIYKSLPIRDLVVDLDQEKFRNFLKKIVHKN